MIVGDLNKVWEIKTLNKVGNDEAKSILERIAKQVQPITHKHKWRVKLLSEFCPKNPSLLGLNVGGGVHVKLRLRRPNREWDFFPFHQILDTMLHELCHNAHGPHNASFYKLWDELRKECEDLMTKGITGTGEGFALSGKRLGGFSRQPPLSSLHKTALTAAEKRAQLLPSGPKCLGGDNSIMSALSPIQAAAMAAERRLQDDLWCEVSGEGEDSSDFSEKSVRMGKSAGTGFDARASDTKQSHESNNSYPEDNFVDLRTDTTVPRKRSRETNDKSLNDQPKSSFVDLSTDASTSGSPFNNGAPHSTIESTEWTCVTCTLLNPPLAPICQLCGTEKPNDIENKYKLWRCKFCTLENSIKLEKCAACEQWRYSHGAPLVHYAPNHGT